jgi:hypothetical protein
LDVHLTPFDALGLVGATMFVVAFAGVQVEKLDPHGWPALTMNFVGAILVLISLAFAFNLASFVLESVWGLIALYGLIKLVLRRRG